MLYKFEPVDIIAVIIIIGAFLLMFFHRDGVVAATLAMIVGYYFGKKASHIPIYTEKK